MFRSATGPVPLTVGEAAQQQALQDAATASANAVAKAQADILISMMNANDKVMQQVKTVMIISAIGVIATIAIYFLGKRSQPVVMAAAPLAPVLPPTYVPPTPALPVAALPETI